MVLIAVLGAACAGGDETNGISTDPTEVSEPSRATGPPEVTPSATGTAHVATPSDAQTADELGTFVFDAATEYAVIQGCVSEAGEDRITYESLMVERGGGRAAYEFVVVDDDPDVADQLYFELYGPGDAGAQFTGTASHELRGDVSAGAGEFDQGGAFAYEVDLSGVSPC